MKTAPCHPDRALYSKGACRQCYDQDYNANRRPPRKNRKSYYVRKDPSEFAPNFRKPPVKEARVPDCHPTRKHVALGLCNACYQQDREGKPRATCHPDQPALVDGICNACYSKRRYWDGPEAHRLRARETGLATRKRDRDELIAAYGGKCACPNCPETNQAFLTLDHVNGDGKAHRLKLGSHTYADLRRQGWPLEGYRLLCWNCNGMTRGGRICPHETQESI